VTNKLRIQVQGLGFRVQGSGFKVQSSRFRVQGARFKVQGSVKNKLIVTAPTIISGMVYF